VLNVTTYDKPKDHPNLDYAADEIQLWICDCWSYRNNSADVSNGEKPSECEPCVHIQNVSKVERAEQDPAQDTLDKNSNTREVFDRGTKTRQSSE